MRATKRAWASVRMADLGPLVARAAAIGAAILLAAGCTPREEVVDLAVGLSLADARIDEATIALGEHTSRWHLASGWVFQRADRHPRMTYAVARSHATVRFRASRPGRVGIHLWGRPVEKRLAIGRALEASVNGRLVGRRTVGPRMRRYTFYIDQGLLRPGTNELTLELVPPDTDPDDPAMAFTAVKLAREASPPSEPRRTADGGGLILPAGTRLDYYLALPENPLLDLSGVEFGAGGAGLLRVLVAEDGVEPMEVLRVDEPERRARADLSAFASRIVRLSLETAPAGGPVGSGADVSLRSARILGPRRPDGAAGNDFGDSEGNDGQRGPTRRNVLLYVVDALRADRLGVYGHQRDVSPRLDRFAERATVFESASAQSSWTRASMASVFTGLWPLAHDTNGREDVLAAEAVTLAEVLADHGYDTIAVALNPNVFADFGFDQGFHEFAELWSRPADHALAEVRSRLASRGDERPFFLWVHTIDPHTPYAAPGEFRSRYDESAHGGLDLERPPGHRHTRRMSEDERARYRDHLLARYDAEIYFADRVFGELIELLERDGLLDRTLLIFVSDHGEEFLDHGKWLHGKDLHRSSLDIPLVIRMPGQEEGRRVSAPVQHIDLMPTVLDFAGIAPPPGLTGRSLLPLVTASRQETPPPIVFSYLHLDGPPYASAIDGRWKLVNRYAEGRISGGLFDLSEDPGERVNLVLEMPIRARYMELQLEARLAAGRRLATSGATIDKRTEAALRALGYLQ